MPPLTFRVEVNYVEVDAVVVNKMGDFVGDLSASDFQVYEDGKPQSVTNFGLVEIPVERAEAPLFVKQPIEPDVQSNIRPFEGRIYLIVLDEMHVRPMHTQWVRAAAKRFIRNTIGANDLAAVISTQGPASQDFTGNKRLLIEAVDKFVGKALQSTTQSKIDDYNMQRMMGTNTSTPRDLDEFQRSYYASSVLSTVSRLADYMAGVRGRRKAMVLFSEGIDYDLTDVINNLNATDVLDRTRDAIASATRANVSVYAVDPRGLTGMVGYDASLGDIPIDADPSIGLTAAGMQSDVRRQHDSLRLISEETGGFASIDSNDFGGAFDRIQKDNSAYYVLGYYPTDSRRDGRFHNIEVRVKRPGLVVRSRKGYIAPRGGKPAAAPPPIEAKEGTSPVLRDALGSPLQVSGLRLTAFAAPFRGPAKSASILLVVQTDGRDFAFKKEGDRYEDTMQMSVAAVDEKAGKVVGGVQHTLRMPLKAENYAAVARTGVRVTSRFEIPPGRYQVRIAAHEVNGKRTGSVYYDLEVPDFNAGPLSMSGLVMAVVGPAEMPTVTGVEDDIRKALPAAPTATRTFRSGEELALLVEVYDNELKSPHKVDIKTTLRADDGRELFSVADERSSSELGGAKGGYGYTSRVPLKGLSAGLYVVKVEARSRLGKGATASREVQIRVTQ